MFSKIKTQIKNCFSINKRTILLIISIITVFLLSTEITFAAETSKAVSNFAIAIDGILKVLASILAIMTILATIFLDPAWISGSLFGLDTAFKDIWILVSNVVYFIFAFILIWIAFMNIVGKGQDKYQLKTALPKFVIGILIVPFTWFFIQFVLSISAILTMAALTLPADTFVQYQTNIDSVSIPKSCTIDLGSSDPTKSYFDCDEAAANKVVLGDLLKGEDGNSSIFGIIASYTYGIISIDKLDEINIENIANGMQKISDLIVKIGFDLLFILIYAILMISLGIALATRGIYLWIYTIISPVFGLMYFFGKKDGGGEGFIKNFSITEFIALAMVPVYTMLALSFGLLFMFVIGQSMSTTDDADKNTASVSSINLDDKGVNVGQFRLNVDGSLLSSVDSQLQVTSFFTQGAATALGVVGTLILQMFSIAVLWIAIMAALKTSSITTAVTQPIRDFGSQVGGLISKMPTYAPIFPGGQSMSSLKHISATGESYFSTKTREKSGAFMEKTGLFQDQSLELRNSANKFNESIKATGELHKEELKQMRDMLSKTDSIFKITSDPEAFKAMVGSAELLKKKGLIQDKDLEGVKSKDRDSIAKVIGALDTLGRNQAINVDVVPGKDLTVNSTNSVVSSQLKDNSKGIPSSSETPKTPETDGTANTTNNDEKADKARIAIEKIDFNSTFALNGFKESDKTITDTDKFAEDLRAKGLWTDGLTAEDFDDLMKKLGIKDEKDLREKFGLPN